MSDVSYKCGPGFGTRGETAYNLRASGKSWDEVAQALEAHSDSAVVKVAKKYAQTRDLPWPIILPEAPEPEDDPTDESCEPSVREAARGRQRLAYESRQQGKGWSEVVAETGYSQVPHAVAGARRYALREGKAWPINTDGCEGAPVA